MCSGLRQIAVSNLLLDFQDLSKNAAHIAWVTGDLKASSHFNCSLCTWEDLCRRRRLTRNEMQAVRIPLAPLPNCSFTLIDWISSHSFVVNDSQIHCCSIWARWIFIALAVWITLIVIDELAQRIISLIAQMSSQKYSPSFHLQSARRQGVSNEAFGQRQDWSIDVWQESKFCCYKRIAG